MGRHDFGPVWTVLLLTTFLLLPACDGEAGEQLEQARAEAQEWQSKYRALETEKQELAAQIEELRARAQEAEELRGTLAQQRQRIARLEEQLQQAEAPPPTEKAVETEQHPVQQVRARLADAGAELFEADQYGGARAVLLSALELGDDSSATLYRLAYSEAASGDLAAAAEHYGACLKRVTTRAEPDRALLVKCLTNAGAVAQRRDEPQAAAALYQQAIAVDERYAPAHFNLGVVYLQSLERPEEGTEALRKHIALGGERAIAARRLIREAQSEGE